MDLLTDYERLGVVALCGFFVIVAMGVFGRVADASAPPTNPYDPLLDLADPVRANPSDSSTRRTSDAIIPPRFS